MARFTDKEKLVLWGLVAWPEDNDNALSSRLGLSRSTVTVIRQRLEEKKLVATRKVPDLEAIGCQVVSALYGEYRADPKLVDGGVPCLADVPCHPTTFHMLESRGHHVSFAAARDFADVKAHVEDTHEHFHAAGYESDKRHSYVLFPLALSAVHRFFDYAPLLKEHFAIEHPGPEPEGNKEPRAPVALSTREKRVLSAMLESPAATDGELAQQTDLSRQTVNAMKKRFDELGLLRTIRIPDVAALGYELACFTHLHLSPHAKIDDRRDAVDYLLADGSHVLKLSGNLEAVLYSVYRDYADFHESMHRLEHHYESAGHLIEDPISKVFPLAETQTVVDHSFTPLADRMLGE